MTTGKTERKKYDSSNRFVINEQEKIDIKHYLIEKPDAKLKKIKEEVGTQASERSIERYLQSVG